MGTEFRAFGRHRSSGRRSFFGIIVVRPSIPELDVLTASYSASSTPPFGIADGPITLRNDNYRIRMTIEEAE